VRGFQKSINRIQIRPVSSYYFYTRLLLCTGEYKVHIRSIVYKWDDASMSFIFLTRNKSVYKNRILCLLQRAL